MIPPGTVDRKYLMRFEGETSALKFLRRSMDRRSLSNFYFGMHLWATFWERRESEDTHEKSIFLLFRQNIPLGELIQGKIV